MDDFFIYGNTVKLTDELDYTRADDYIRSAEAFSRCTYQSVYIIDYHKKNFLYASPNPIFLCGMTSEQFLDAGYNFYLKYVPEEEQQFLLEVNRKGFAFFNQIPLEERKDWYISYDFHITHDNRRILVNHKLTPLALTSDGTIWLAMCIVSLSTNTAPGHLSIHKTGTPYYYMINPVTRQWERQTMPSLTDGEKSVLRLSIQGYTMTEIADRICLSQDTVKKYRQHIFKKLKVRNIPEAIAAATNKRLL